VKFNVLKWFSGRHLSKRRLSTQLLAFNLLLLFLPLASLLYLDTYEEQLLDTQEDSMIQQGRIFASSLEGADLAAEAAVILERLSGRVDSRIRVIDKDGRLLADSASIQPAKSVSTAESDSTYALKSATVDTRGANERVLYRTVVYPLNVLRRLFLPPGDAYDSGEYYSGKTTLLGPEVLAALQGRYGAITRLSTGGQVSVNLYSAIPIKDPGADGVVGAVLVSRSTYGILLKLYELRLDIIKIFLFSLLAAVLISLVVSLTITIPIHKLKDEAGRVLDNSGRLGGRFTGLKRKDEIGDLSRALSELSGRLEKRIAFIDGFTADLLHELKNPLAAIRGAVDVALDTPQDAVVSGRSLLLRIGDEELRMERLLSRLRELSRIDNRLDVETTDLVDLADLVPLVLSRYPHKDFPRVHVDFRNETHSPARVRINPDRLVQLLANPVDNAVSFSPLESRVAVTLSEGSVAGIQGYLLTVTDCGPGIRPSSLPRIFDRFYSDRAEVDVDAHTGLGLAIVKAIAEGYGGACAIENLQQGGCRFSLVIPKAL